MKQHEPDMAQKRCTHCGVLWHKTSSADCVCIWRSGEEPLRERKISVLDDVDTIYARIQELNGEPQAGK